MAVSIQPATPDYDYRAELQKFQTRWGRQFQHIVVLRERLLTMLEDQIPKWEHDPSGPWRLDLNYLAGVFPGQRVNFDKISGLVVLTTTQVDTEHQRAVIYRVEDNRIYWIEVQHLKP